MSNSKTGNIARFGLITAAAMVLSYIESLVPMSFAVPGVKLGLANIAVVFALYKLGAKNACLVSLLRALLVAMTFGNMFSLWYSLGGAALSLAVMIPLRHLKFFSSVGVSVSGAVAHNLGQLIVAAIVLETGSIMYYFVPLLVSASVSGVLVGIAAGELVRRVKTT